MYFDVFPMLTKGSFAKYYGGKEILPNLSDRSGSIISPILMGSSVVFQLIFVMFKKYKFRKVMTRRRNTVTYEGYLINTIFSGLTNMYSMLALAVFVAAGFSIVVVHYYAIELNRKMGDKKEEDFDNIPFRKVAILLISTDLTKMEVLLTGNL